ncbi:MAG: M16 family metallopeptidase [Victivallaceae bacterium]
MRKIFETIKMRSFDNGLRVYVLERPGQPSAEIQCRVETGSIHEEEFLGSGLSHFLEHMLFQGCRDYAGTTASDRIHALGGDVNAYTSFDHTLYYAELPARNAVAGIDVLASMVRHAELPEARFVAERDVILRECELGRDNPDRRLAERLWQSLYLRHPARIPIIGYPGNIAEVSREMTERYYRLRYTPGRTFWVAVGALEAEAVFDAVGKLHGDWSGTQLAEPVLPVEPPLVARRREETIFADPLGRIGLAAHLPDASSDELAAIEVMTGLLGMSDASHLVRELQQRRELATRIDAYSYVQNFGGVLGITAAASPAKLAKLERGIFRVLDGIAKSGFSAAEVRREKTQQLAEALRALRGNHGIAAVIAASVAIAGTPEFAARSLEKLERLTVDEVNAAARRYCDSDRFAVVIQRPPELRAAMKKAVAADVSPIMELARPSGLKLISAPDHSLPLAEFALMLPGGALYEDAAHSGASRLLGNLLACGGGKWDEEAFADRLETLGAVLDCSAGLNSFSVKGNVLRKNFAAIWDLVLTMLAEPRLEERIFERERANAIDELASRMCQVRYVADRTVAGMVYGDHPYGRGVAGSEASLVKFKRDDLLRFYRSWFHYPRLALAFGGDLREDEIERAAAAFEARIAPVTEPVPMQKPPGSPDRPGERRIEVTERDQTVVNLAYRICDCRCDENLAFMILGEAMNGLASPLFKRIREDNALAYSTGMRMVSGFYPGMVTFFAITEPAKADLALGLLREEVKKLVEKGLDKRAFEDARSGAIFTLERMLADPAGRLYDAALSVYYGEPADECEREMAKLAKFKRSEFNRVLKRYLGCEAGQTVIAGRGGA